MSADVATIPQKRSPLVSMAARMGVEPDKLFLDSLRQVAFNAPNVTNEQLLALCVVANQYGLNPFTRELYAFPDTKRGGIVPVVSVDGWARLANDHPAFNGLEFVEDDAGGWIECVVYRKDRDHPIRVREYLAECRRDTPPWKSHPRRMLRHRAMTQAIRLAFGFAGIYEQDEAERIVDVTPGRAEKAQGATQTDRVKSVLLQAEPVAEVPAAVQSAEEFAAELGDEP